MADEAAQGSAPPVPRQVEDPFAGPTEAAAGGEDYDPDLDEGLPDDDEGPNAEPGVPDGEHVEYDDETGMPVSKANFLNGKLHGEFVEYGPAGQPSSSSSSSSKGTEETGPAFAAACALMRPAEREIKNIARAVPTSTPRSKPQGEVPAH